MGSQARLSCPEQQGRWLLLSLPWAELILHMIGAGRLHEALRLTQQAMLRWVRSREVLRCLRWAGLLFQAEILREWNDIDAALSGRRGYFAVPTD